MEKLIIPGLIITILCVTWMFIQTKRYHTKDKKMWLILSVFIPVIAVLIFYFTEIKNKKLS